MPSHSNTFVEDFNRRLGQHTGSRALPLNPDAISVDLGGTRTNRDMNLFFKVLEARDKKREEADKLEPLIGSFTGDTIGTLTSSSNYKPDSGSGFWGGLKDKLGAVGDGVLDVGSFALDQISRPFYGVSGFTHELMESRNEGQNPLESLDDAIRGFGSGVALNEKHGWGDVVEEASKFEGDLLTDPLYWAMGGPLAPSAVDQARFGAELINKIPGTPDIPTGAIPTLNPAALGVGLNDPALQNMNVSLGDIPGANKIPILGNSPFLDPNISTGQHLKQIYGLAGDLAADPLNYVGVGVAGKVRQGSKVVDYSEDAYRALARQAAEEVVTNHGLSSQFNKIQGFAYSGRGTTANVPKGMAGLDKIIDEAAEKTLIEINKGATGGRILGARTAPGTFASHIANGIRTHMLAGFEKNYARIIEHLDGTRPLSVADIKKLSKDPQTAKFFDNLLDEYNKARKVNKYSNVADILNRPAIRTGRSWAWTESKAIKAADDVRHELDNLLIDTRNELYDKMAGTLFNAPGIKIAGKTYSVSSIGSGYAKVRNVVGDAPLIRNVSFARQFPDRTAMISNKIRALGVADYEVFAKQVREAAAGLTKAQRRELTEHLLRETIPSDPKLAQAYKWLKDQYAQFDNMELDAGIRDAGYKPALNYAYLWFKGDNFRGSRQVKEAKEEIRRIVKKTNRMPADSLQRYSKLRPEHDAFRALLLRKMESNRKLTRAWFMKDLINTYGLKANGLNKITESRAGLKSIERTTRDLQLALNKGEKWYLPKDIKEIFDHFDDLLRPGVPESVQGIVRVLDRLTRFFKASATIPYPGFHIRNAIGDIIMSHLDGVKFEDYKTAAQMLRNAADPATSTKIYKIGKQDYTYEQLKDLFYKNSASGGFYHTDLGAEGLAKVAPSRLAEKARELSTRREDFFRFAHFLKAFKEEASLNTRRGLKPAALERQALEAASYRVNKYLFDYGALTSFEKNTLRRIIPFYTYSRKVMPALAESMFLRPSFFSKTERFFGQNDFDPNAMFNDMLVPEYQREFGYARLTDEQEPWILGSQFLPTNMLVQNLNFSSDQGLFRNILAQSNPFLRAPIERAAGEQFFNGMPIDSGSQYYSQAALPFLKPLQDLLGGSFLSGVPGVPDNPSESVAERIASGRFGLGLPFDKVSLSQQESRLYQLDEELKEKLSTFNPALEAKGLRVYLSARSNGTSFRIRELESGRTVAEAETPEEIEKKIRLILRD
jgi:hypothetical protein